MKKILGIILIMTLIVTTVMTAHAVPAPMYVGDLDHDNDLTILDATRIQRWLVGLEELDAYREKYPDWITEKLALYLGDVNGDGSCDILDATFIQRYAAGMIDARMWDFSTWAYYIDDIQLYADRDSGKAVVGKPVTFHAQVPGYHENDEFAPYTYAFFINGEKVKERSEQTDMTYTFTKTGYYTISVTCYNRLDCTAGHRISNYQVAEPYPLDQPMIVSTRFRDDSAKNFGEGPLCVRAEGGDAPYQYMYRIVNCDEIPLPDGWYAEEQTDPAASLVYTTGYIDSPVLEIPASIYRKAAVYEPFTIIVTARDSSGAVSEPVTIDYFVEHLIG